MPLVTNIKQAAKSKGLANGLIKYPVLGNLAFALLVGYSLYSIVEKFAPQITFGVYEQERITQGDMDAVCKNKRFYQQKLRQSYSPVKDVVVPQGVEYRNDVKDVYPVFRWSCKYSIKPKSSPDELSELSGSGVSPDYVYTGLSLDEYHCELFFKASRLTKATYLNPKNPHSWYCTNANPDL
ncbi:MAG: hypothetical protein AB8B99_09940 [Phormidesmis sp.]